jgi:hypothetical protein
VLKTHEQAQGIQQLNKAVMEESELYFPAHPLEAGPEMALAFVFDWLQITSPNRWGIALIEPEDL